MLVQASGQGVSSLGLKPAFAVKAEGVGMNERGESVFLMKKSQAILLGIDENAIAIQGARYQKGLVGVHKDWLSKV